MLPWSQVALTLRDLEVRVGAMRTLAMADPEHFAQPCQDVLSQYRLNLLWLKDQIDESLRSTEASHEPQ